MGQASCHGYDYFADRSVIATNDASNGTQTCSNGKGQYQPALSSKEVIRSFNDSCASLKNCQSKLELLVTPDARDADANADAGEEATGCPSDSAENSVEEIMSAEILNRKTARPAPLTPVACVDAECEKEELQPPSADTTVADRCWDTTPRSEASASASSSSSFARSQRQKLKSLEEQRLEEEKRREAERIQKDQRMAARVAAILEERRQEEELRIKRDKDAKQLEAFLLKHNYVAVNSKTKKEVRKWGKYDYPLHKAVKLSDEQLVRILLEFGASPEVKNSSSKTPLDKAREKKLGASEDWSKRDNIVVLLQNKDIQPHFRSNVSTTCSSGDFSRRLY